MMASELVTVWSGALERAGLVGGLSAHRGASTLGSSDAWSRAAALADIDGVKELYRSAQRVTVRRAILDPATGATAVALYRAGVGYGGIARKLGTTRWCVRGAIHRQLAGAPPSGGEQE